jgi:hypothetical protein
MAQGKTLNIRMMLNDKQFQTGLRKASRSISKFGKKMERVGRTMSTSLTLPIAAAGIGAVKMASDFEESLNKTRVAFGKSSVFVEQFAQTTLKSFGIAEGSALEMSSLFGDMATSMGLTQREASQMAMSLTGLAGDLASFKNIGVEQAQTALAGIFTGETESLKKMGLLITESTLKQYGFNKSMSQTEKIAIRYKAILDQTTNAQGDYARTSGGMANTSRTLQESIKELSVEFGQVLMPIALKIVNFLQKLVNGFRGLDGETKKTILGVTLFVGAIGPLLIIVGKLTQGLLALVSPMTALALVFAAVATGIAYLTENWNAFITSILKTGPTLTKLVSFLLKGMTNIAPGLLATAHSLDALGDAMKNGDLNPDDLDSDWKSFGDTMDDIFQKIKKGFASPFKSSEGGAGELGPQRIMSKGAGQIDTGAMGGMLTASLPDNFTDEADNPLVQTSVWAEAAVENIQKFGAVMSDVFQTVGSVMETYYARQTELIENERNEKLLQLEESHAYVQHLQAQEARRLANMDANERREHAMKKDYENRKARIDKEAADKKAALELKMAKWNKAQAAVNAAINTALGVTTALATGNVALATIIGILGAVEVGAILAEPLPSLADGGIAFGESIVRVGEYSGANVNPEVIAPLNKLENMMGGNQVQVVGTITGNDIMLSNARTSVEYNQRLV